MNKNTSIAIHIIEEVVEPLMNTMATNIRNNKKATTKSIIKELERGMEGDAYYEMEDAIVKILKQSYAKKTR